MAVPVAPQPTDPSLTPAAPSPPVSTALISSGKHRGRSSHDLVDDRPSISHPQLLASFAWHLAAPGPTAVATPP
jgi:hypothetical protein